MVYVNREVAVQPHNIPTVENSASNKSNKSDHVLNNLSQAKTPTYAPPHPQNLLPHEHRKTFSQINGNANGNGTAYGKPNADTSYIAPLSYNHHGVPQTQPQTQPQAFTAFQPQAMQYSNLNPPYVPPPQTHMDLTNFQSRPLYSTKDFAFQPIGKFIFSMSKDDVVTGFLSERVDFIVLRLKDLANHVHL